MKAKEEREELDCSTGLMRKTLLVSFLFHFFCILALGYHSLPKVTSPKGEIWDVSLIKLEKPRVVKKEKLVAKKVEPQQEKVVKVPKKEEPKEPLKPKKEKVEVAKVQKEEPKKKEEKVVKAKEKELEKKEEKVVQPKKEEVKQLAMVQKKPVEPKPLFEPPQPPSRPVAPSPSTSLSATTEETLPPELSWYIEMLRKLVWQNWEEPRYGVPRGTRAKVVIRFVIDRQGKLMAEPKVFESSQIPLLDQSGMRAIISSKPFPPLPKGFEDNSLGIRFGFEYGVEET